MPITLATSAIWGTLKVKLPVPQPTSERDPRSQGHRIGSAEAQGGGSTVPSPFRKPRGFGNRQRRRSWSRPSKSSFSTGLQRNPTVNDQFEAGDVFRVVRRQIQAGIGN